MDRTAVAEHAKVSRRDFMRTAAVGTAVAGSAVAIPSFLTTATAAAASPFGTDDPDLHLLQRATWGATPGGLKSIRKRGRKAWLDDQLHPSTLDDSFCKDLITKRFPGLAWDIRGARRGIEEFSWDLMFDLGIASIARATWSRRQLFEVMVDFWSNHLNVTNPFDSGWDNRHDYDRTVIRKHALGRFEDMLAASARHPAMMYYLNNAESTKYSPNENYGRELLELHSVGVDGGYDEVDMRNSTLVMTGLSVDWETGLFAYYKSDHYTGPVQVMDWSSANASGEGGLDVAMSYVRYLARHPSTARRIATRLCERFVSDSPPPELVNRLAQVYSNNGTAIVPVLRELFSSPAFGQSKGAKIRRPMQDVVSTLRILAIKPDARGVEGMQGLYWMIEGLGDAPLAWVPPNGYPDVADAWRSAGGYLGRWNAHMSLAAGWWPDELVRAPLRDLLPTPLPATHGGYVDALAKRLVFRKLATEHRQAVFDFLEVNENTPLDADDAAVRWRLAHVVALILDSPYHQVR